MTSQEAYKRREILTSGPEHLQMLNNALRMVLCKRNTKLGEHAHVSTLQTETSLEQGDQLIEIAIVLVLANNIATLFDLPAGRHSATTSVVSSPTLFSSPATGAEVYLERYGGQYSRYLQDCTLRKGTPLDPAEAALQRKMKMYRPTVSSQYRSRLYNTISELKSLFEATDALDY